MLRNCLIAFALLYAPMTYAADAPKSWTVDMTTVLTDENNRPIKDEFDTASPATNLTLGHAIAHALFYVAADEKDVTSEQKWAWAIFAEKIRDDAKVQLTNTQGDLIYKRISKLYNGVVLMRAMPLIDPNRKPPAIE